MSRECERLWEVNALREGRLAPRDIESFARHREGCDECRARFAEDERLRTLGRALSAPPVDPFHARRLRQSILRAAATDPRRSPVLPRARVGAVCALGVGLAIFAVAVGRESRRSPVAVPVPTVAVDRPFGATIEPEPGAAWETRTDGLVEHVRLSAGAIALTVRHRGGGERFVVDLPDGEIEVRGTSFRVDVLGQTTRSVRVFEGRVAWRRNGANEVLLAAGETWSAEPAQIAPAGAADLAPSARGHASLSSSAASPAGANAMSRRSPIAAAAPPPADDSDYEAAVDLFTSGHYDEAARALHALATAHPERVFAEDAAFLEASALARTGRPDAAAVVAERFLERYPASLHAADAATLVARAARDRHDCPRAQSVATRWITDPAARATALGACSRHSE